MTRGLPQGPDNFEMRIIQEFAGYNSSIDPTKQLHNQSEAILTFGSQNVYKKLSGTIANRPGLKTRGANDVTAAGTKSSYEWNAWDATVRPVRINNNKLQIETDILVPGSLVWYTLLSGLATTFNRSIFDAVWDTTLSKDILLMVGGTPDMYHWSGAMAIFVSYAGSVITLDRDATVAGFASGGGTITINGTSYTYSGISGSTLTGTSDATAEVPNSAAFDAVGTSSNTPASGYKNDFIKVINNQVYVGSYTSNAIYLSRNSGAGNYADYSQSATRLTGEGGIIYLSGTGRGIGVKGGNAWIGCGSSDWWVITFAQISNNSILTEQIKQERKPVSINSAPLGQEFIDNIGDELVVLTQDQQVRLIGNYSNQFTLKYASLSLAVQTEFAGQNFTGGHLVSVGNFIRLTSPVNGVDYFHETRESVALDGSIVTEKFWHPPQIRNISRFAVISGTVYGHSNAYPMIFKVENTGQWYDDTPTGDQLPYTCIALFNYMGSDRRQGKRSFSKLFSEGYATPNSELYYTVYFDYQGSTFLANNIVNTPDSPFKKTFTGVVPPSLGDASLGDNPLGGGTNVFDDQAQVPKWKQLNSIQQVDCYEYAVAFYTENASARWELLAFGTDEKMSIFSGIELIKTTPVRTQH